MKKIDIYYNNEYICSTSKSKTCKEAKQNFINNPNYKSLPFDIEITNANDLNIKCKFSK